LVGRAGLTVLAGVLLAGCSGDHPATPGAAGPSASSAAATTPSGTASGGAVTTTAAGPTPTGQPPTGGETTGDQPKACTLVTGVEAATALGRAVGPPDDRVIGRFSSCSFAASGGRLATVTVQVLQSPATVAAFDRIVASQSGAAATRPVPGVGDKAVLAAGVLLFHKRTTVVSVLIYTGGEANATNAEVALAKKIAAKI
jgi:hypothetical protein